MRDVNGKVIEVGMIITNGNPNRAFVNRQMKGEVLYVDRWSIVWKPLTEFTKKHLNIEGESTTITFNNQILIVEDNENKT